MVCPKCGGINESKNWRCGNCQYVFREYIETREANWVDIQPSLKQPQQSELTTINSSTVRPTPETVDITLSTQGTHNISQRQDSISDAISPINNVTAPSPHARAKEKKQISRNLVYVVVAIFFLVVINIIIYQQFSGSESAELFAAAEKAFAAKDYPAAQVLYKQFLVAYPENDLAATAQVRMSEIRIDHNEMQQQRKKRIETLVMNAEAAFRETRLLVPAKNNVIAYTSEVLKIDPQHTRALELQSMVVEYYRSEAKEAKRKRHYNIAIKNYKKILRIIPNDKNTRRALDELLASIARR